MTEQLTDNRAADRHWITGQYRVRVDALDNSGEARGRVLEALRPPSSHELDQIFGERRDTEHQTEGFTFIGGLPGEIVDVEVRWSLPRPGRKRARRVPQPTVRVARVVVPAPERVEALCPVFGECGGCQLQHLSYAAQLRWKTDRVRTALNAVGFTAPPVQPALGCDPPWNYRNHMRFSVNREGQAGLTARGTHRVLPLRVCPIAHPRINEALTAMAEYPLPRPQMLVRYAESTGHLLLQPSPEPALRAQLETAGATVRDADMEERLAGEPFRIRPSSFFQTNTRQANRMAEIVLDLLAPRPGTTMVDAYCGVGTFARLLARRGGAVIAIEESASAIRDARWNLRDLPNVTIVQAKVEDVLPELHEQLDGLVIDPPRAGCQTAVLDTLIARRVSRVVYVSCNPDTLARDLAYLCLRAGAYRPVSIQPLDMFPQTAHVESVVLLEAL